MTGFGKILREEGIITSAMASERLGNIYLCYSSVGAILRFFASAEDSTMFAAIQVAFDIAGIILVFLMYRRASDVAFLIWEKQGTVIAKGLI